MLGRRPSQGAGIGSRRGSSRRGSAEAPSRAGGWTSDAGGRHAGGGASVDRRSPVASSTHSSDEGDAPRSASAPQGRPRSRAGSHGSDDLEKMELGGSAAGSSLASGHASSGHASGDESRPASASAPSSSRKGSGNVRLDVGGAYDDHGGNDRGSAHSATHGDDDDDDDDDGRGAGHYLASSPWLGTAAAAEDDIESGSPHRARGGSPDGRSGTPGRGSPGLIGSALSAVAASPKALRNAVCGPSSPADGGNVRMPRRGSKSPLRRGSPGGGLFSGS